MRWNCFPFFFTTHVSNFHYTFFIGFSAIFAVCVLSFFHLVRVRNFSCWLGLVLGLGSVWGVVCHIAELFCSFSFASCQLRFVCCFSVSVLNISWLIIGQSVRRVQIIPFSLRSPGKVFNCRCRLDSSFSFSFSQFHIAYTRRSVNKIFTILLIFLPQSKCPVLGVYKWSHGKTLFSCFSILLWEKSFVSTLCALNMKNS